jgi:putative SOS response-associated peptidase YedK
MCGRFAVLETVPDLALRFAFTPVEPLPPLPAVNVAPSQQVLAVRLGPEGTRFGTGLRWGLIPRWARDPAIGHRLINARAETVASRPAFRRSWQARRWFVPASGFYEWQRQGGRAQPYFFRSAEGGPLALAALWDRWEPPVGPPVESLTLITVPADRAVAPVHDRMPLILADPEQLTLWLDPRTPPERLAALWGAPWGGRLESYPVTPKVNAPTYQEADAVAPWASGDAPPP